MTNRRFDLPDLLFGLFLIIVAAGTLVATWHLAGGTAANMGPGYMPRAIALILIGFGLFFAGRSFLKAHQGISRVQMRPLLAIIISVALFALLAEQAGLLVASFIAVLAAGFATAENRLIESSLFSIAIASGAALLFIKVLALPIPLWPW